MMQMKKVVSLIMVLVMMLTIAVIPGTFSAANTDNAATSVNTASDYGLASNIQSGNILHAFNWRMTDLVKYAPEIAAAGYSSVQISPIQATKVTSNDGSYATDWWSFYQPTDMTVGNALGSAADLKAATTELHKYGIKVIADVVTNHVQNCTSRKESAQVASALSSTSTGARHSLTTHPLVTSDSSRQAQVQGDLGGQLPDMNTGLESYQNYVINNLLNPLADNGVDGFRFDAAKHIETPDDGAYASQYWPKVTSAIKAKNSNAYIYGEILATGGQFNISSYTKYINVTDYAYGNTVRAALNSKSASALANYGYSGSSKSQNVLWVESHDNFTDYTSTSLNKKQQILGWAIVGSRAEAPALFFVRPVHEALDSSGFIKYDDLMGAPGSADTWKDSTVVAVNKFKNAFVGQSETDYNSGANFFVQRGTTGMVIVNLNGSSASISQSCSMANGSYKDQVSGNTFQVSGGKITGTVGSTGVAVIYNTDSVPTMTVKLNNEELDVEASHAYSSATATVSVTLANVTSGTIKVSNLEDKTVGNGTTTFTLNSSIASGKAFNFTVTATNGTKSISNTYTLVKDTSKASRRVYFDNSATKWDNIYVFTKTSLNASGTFPGTKMTLQSGNIYYADVPANTTYVKFNEGPVSAHIGHTASQCAGYCGRTLPPTVVNYGPATQMANLIKGGYELIGTMICRNLRMEPYNYSTANLTAADTTLYGLETPTEPTTPQPTTPDPTEKPTEPVGRKLLLGDADQDGIVTILDATMIQRHDAKIITLSEDGQLCADVDKNENIDSVDVTWIQRYRANMGNPKNIGEYFYVGGDEPAPTETPDPEPTTPSGDLKELVKLSNKFVVVIYCEAAGTTDASRNSEHALDAYGRLTYNFQGPSYVFARNYDTRVQYATNGWTNFANPVTLVNQKDLTDTFDKMFVPAGEHTLYLQPGEGDTYTLEYDGSYKDPGTVTEDPTIGGGGDNTEISFLLTDNFNWGKAYVYAWDANGNALCGEWPGASQAETIVNDYGETQFKCVVPAGAVGVILNNGSGAQTEDITDFGTYDGYWMNGTKNSLGHYIVTGWNY